MSRSASVAMRSGAKEKAAAAKAVADAEADLASGVTSDGEDSSVLSDAGGDSASGGGGASARTSITSAARAVQDPFDTLWAGFSIPKKLAKFVLVTPGREILEIGQFELIEKKVSVLCYLILATDVAFIARLVEADVYELLATPEQRNKVKGSLVKMDGVFAMKVKIGKAFTLKCTTELERSQWIGKLNAPIGFIPTKALSA
jgi:hypothetical protein